MTTTYEVRVEGQLDSHWSGFLGGLSLRHEADGTSTLTGPVADQAQLYGLLAGLRDIGASLLSVRALREGGALSEETPSEADGAGASSAPGAAGHHAGGRGGRPGHR